MKGLKGLNMTTKVYLWYDSDNGVYHTQHNIPTLKEEERRKIIDKYIEKGYIKMRLEDVFPKQK